MPGPELHSLFARAAAFFAGTDFAQPPPGINDEIVAIVPFEFHGVLADGFSREGLRGFFKDGQLAGFEVGLFAWSASGFGAFFIAQRARTGIAEKWKSVLRKMPITPLDFDAGAGFQVNFDGCGIGNGHQFSIANFDGGSRQALEFLRNGGLLRGIHAVEGDPENHNQNKSEHAAFRAD